MCFLELLPQWLAIDASPSFKTVWKASMVVLSRHRFKKSSNLMPRGSTLLAWADVRVVFPSALMRVDALRVVALMAFFCSIHRFLCNCGDRMERLDRHSTCEGCNTLSMAKTSGKSRVLSIRIQSHIIFCIIIIIIVPTFNVTPSNFYVVEATLSERCTLEDLNSYFYYYYSISVAIILILITLIIIIYYITIT